MHTTNLPWRLSTQSASSGKSLHVMSAFLVSSVRADPHAYQHRISSAASQTASTFASMLSRMNKRSWALHLRTSLASLSIATRTPRCAPFSLLSGRLATISTSSKPNWTMPVPSLMRRAANWSTRPRRRLKSRASTRAPSKAVTSSVC